MLWFSPVNQGILHITKQPGAMRMNETSTAPERVATVWKASLIDWKSHPSFKNNDNNKRIECLNDFNRWFRHDNRTADNWTGRWDDEFDEVRLRSTFLRWCSSRRCSRSLRFLSLRISSASHEWSSSASSAQADSPLSSHVSSSLLYNKKKIQKNSDKR